LKDPTRCFPDDQIAKQTGRSGKYNECLSSLFVRFPPEVRYGTRSHTVILVDKNDNVLFHEERMTTYPVNAAEAQWSTEEFRFELEMQ